MRGGTLSVGLPYDIDTLNVYSTGFLGQVEAAVVEGLLAPDAQARYVPVLATEVPTLGNGGIELDGTAMRVTYHLRPGVLWQDGVAFTSADVRFTWEAVRNPAFLAESKEGADEVASIDTPDALTVIVNYRRTAPAFAATLFTFGILPRHALIGHDLNHDSYNDKPLGTGPFVVKTFQRGDYVVLERNPLYWRRDAAGTRLPYLDRIVFRIIPDSNTLGTLIRAGEIELAPLIPSMLAEQLAGTRGIEIVKGPSLGWDHLDFNLKRATPLRELAVRRAIAHAIDRSSLVRAAGGFAQPIRSVVVPLLGGLYDPSVPCYDYAPARAEALLDQAGWRRRAGGVRARRGTSLRLGITAQSGQIDDEIAEQIIIAQLAAVGIDVRADNKNGVSFRQARYQGDYDLLYGRWVTSADPSYSVFFGSRGANNGQGYSDPRLDAAMRTIETDMQPQARRRAAALMQRILYEDVPTVPLLGTVSLDAKSLRLRNYQTNPTNMTAFTSAWRWFLAPTGTRRIGDAPR